MSFQAFIIFIVFMVPSDLYKISDLDAVFLIIILLV